MKHARSDYDPIQDPRGLIPADEPVMLIRGQDQAAIPAMRAWVEAHLQAGGGRDLAELIVDHMGRVATWQDEHVRKVADL